MNETPLYPLRFEPIYQYRVWGGRRLGNLLSTRLPGDDPVGEAWLLSDRDDQASLVADGPLKGKTLRQLLAQSPQQISGPAARDYIGPHPSPGKDDLPLANPRRLGCHGIECRGRSIVKTHPERGRSRNRRTPLFASTLRRQIASPSPIPDLSSPFCVNG